MPRHGRILPVAPEAGEARIYEPRIRSTQRLWAELQALQRLGPERVDQDIGCEEELPQELVSGGGLDVEC